MRFIFPAKVARAPHRNPQFLRQAWALRYSRVTLSLRLKAGMPDRIPPDVRDFVERCIGSVAELEALLLLRETPDSDWDATTLASRLYIGESEGANILEHLAQCGLAGKTAAGFRYQVSDGERLQLVDRLADSHAKMLVPLTRLIHDKATGIRKFADAFKFRKDT